LTLLMAYVFAATWVRSRIADDLITISTGWSHTFVESRHAAIEVEYITQKSKEWMGTGGGILNWKSRPHLEKRLLLKSLETYDVKWHWKAFGFHCGIAEYTSASGISSPGVRCQVQFCVFPYWSIVLSLTLLSVYLLLIKPGIARPKSVVEDGGPE
jgi:hypothetical protein